MNWRAAFLSGVLAAGLTLSFIPRAVADPPPWAGAWRHAKHGDGDHDRDDRGYWRHRHGDAGRANSAPAPERTTEATERGVG